MKIKTIPSTLDAVAALPRLPHKKPRKRSFFWQTLARLIVIPDLWATHFTCSRDRATEPKEPCLVLMNHSSFLDLKIAFKILYPRPFHVVATTDALVGKPRLMRWLGCIPTQKFVSDMTLIRDIKYALHELDSSVLMYPEAGYSFDGRATTLPDGLGNLLKMLDVPVMTVVTHGAFARDPLYNGLQNRKVRVSAEYRCLFTREQVQSLTVEELNTALREIFSFDQFAWQQEEKVRIDEPFRADGLHRILYKCPTCGAEGSMEGKDIHLTCHACEKTYTLTEYGRLEATEGVTEFSHIPDWYDWERATVRAELEAGTYGLDAPVRIGMLVDAKGLYMVESGRLTHGPEGFRLTVPDGEGGERVVYEQKPQASHSLNADFFWYEIGDVIGLGDRKGLYYCFPQPVDGQIPPVAKVRLAAEELYRMTRKR